MFGAEPELHRSPMQLWAIVGPFQASNMQKWPRTKLIATMTMYSVNRCCNSVEVPGLQKLRADLADVRPLSASLQEAIPDRRSLHDRHMAATNAIHFSRINNLSEFITNAKCPAKICKHIKYSNHLSCQASKDLDSQRLAAPARRCAADIPERWKLSETHSHGSMHPPPWQRQQIQFRGPSRPEKCESESAIGRTSSKVDALIVLPFKRVWGRATKQLLKNHAGPFWVQVKVRTQNLMIPSDASPKSFH